jgi:tetratricopeptide (TPR) repeat protein
MNDSFLSYRARGLEALQSGQYERAKELFTVALELNPRDPVTLYQLGVVEFNLGRAEEGRARLEQAHTALPLKTNPNVVELHVEGDYTFVPVNKDEWSLHLKGKTTRPGEGLPESGEPPSAFLLDVDAVYEMEVARAEDDARKSSRSRALISIPIGLMLVWLFAR